MLRRRWRGASGSWFAAGEFWCSRPPWLVALVVVFVLVAMVLVEDAQREDYLAYVVSGVSCVGVYDSEVRRSVRVAILLAVARVAGCPGPRHLAVYLEVIYFMIHGVVHGMRLLRGAAAGRPQAVGACSGSWRHRDQTRVLHVANSGQAAQPQEQLQQRIAC